MGTELAHQERNNYDEILMQHRTNITDSLKDLKNLRKQFYSAAEYFEVSYGKDEHKQELVDTMKVYVSKAVINTVDHLGSIAAKLDTFLDEKVGEFSATELRFSCVEQRSRSCQEFIDRNGIEQQSFVTVLPKYLKHCINPGSDVDTVSDLGKSNRRSPMMTILYPGRDEMHQNQHHQLQQGFLATKTKEHPTLPRRRLQNNLTFTQTSPNPPAFTFTRAASSKELDSRGKLSVSPLRFRLKRSESYIHRSPPFSPCDQFRPQPQRTISLPTKPAKPTSQNMKKLQSNKTKRTLQSLLSFQFTD
ncbi:PREDICTED: protein ABIL2-like isoform X2 [Ipomoea nil]|uniref:protein ABIL2-like isoform X2 n=1 Tax=Ipomoea nil TaxID=35883 RepID=UPI0009019382|nr:PREDICTED: protein ABIL2-like isoform X2 [Ipomoea nil]